MTKSSSFQVSQGYDIMPPRPGKAYPILCEEWNYLKEKVRSLSDASMVYHTFGALLCGIAISTLIAILTGQILGGMDPDVQVRLIIAWAIVVVTIVCGSVFLYFARAQRKVRSVRASDVIAQMELIEKRYEAVPQRSVNKPPECRTQRAVKEVLKDVSERAAD